MSAYVCFYLKHPDSDKYLPIGSFCRSSDIYRAVQHTLPWEEGIAVDDAWLTEATNEIDNQIKSYEDLIKREEETIKHVSTFNNSVNDKMEAIYDCNNSIVEATEELEWLKWSRGYLDSLQTIYHAIDYDDDFTDEDRKNYLWAGIEWNPNYKEEV